MKAHKLLPLFLALAMVFLVACSGKTDLTSDESSRADSSSDQATSSLVSESQDPISDGQDSSKGKSESAEVSSEDDSSLPASSTGGDDTSKTESQAPTEAPTPTKAPTAAPTPTKAAPTPDTGSGDLLPGSKSNFFTDLKVSDRQAALKFMENSVFSEGSEFIESRIAAAMKKAESGQDITIGFTGGSITHGAGASAKARSYAGIVHSWWKSRFPNSEVTLINIGEGGRGSFYADQLIQERLLDYEPDFVIADYSVNYEDGVATPEQLRSSYNSVLDKIMKSKNKPGIIHIAFAIQFTGTDRLTNNQEMHKEVASSYGVPVLSFLEAIKYEIEVTGRLTFAGVHGDEVHPNNQGHAIAGDIINYYLLQIYKNRNAY